jgi:hypothetical protein
LQFLTKSRKSILRKVLWKKYVRGKQTAPQLAKEYKCSEKWIRQELDKAIVKKPKIRPCSVVVVADMTFIRRAYGIAVIRAPHLKKNLVWKMAETETIRIYQELRFELERQGFEIEAAVIDGKPGLFDVFWDVHIQMCHFHQIQIINRYLTTRPKLPASQELRRIALHIPRSYEDEMRRALDDWHERWEEFLKEKTFNPETRRWFYTHKRVRSAYRSLGRNLPLLYTYQKYPELHIPNTTNSLDGSFSHLKDMLRIHRGLKKNRKLKLIDELLSK